MQNVFKSILGKANIVRLLLENEANVNAVDKNHMTSLHYSARSGNLQYDKKQLHHLLYCIDEHQQNVSISYIILGHDVAAELLIQNGVNVDAMDKNLMTALMWASRGGNSYFNL